MREGKNSRIREINAGGMREEKEGENKRERAECEIGGKGE